ncbi:hypothetical protein NSZ01_29470 [Nocardioides szechwanensis]|uniref:Secreted protein n=1 Tax=Nocardioides szechwanensis TaxID=1005944 RepID=A0A1H0DLA1_9ACTN|nr:hypothetical protein [Nocardioides szechwanensis]GEP35179.1 hypothetical protein NSZ01_29470 [Nocardioides szechwanensis]SDN70922.1 hypothetical protein SAMN05192576_2604 [Nocardioides szechwanensis]
METWIAVIAAVAAVAAAAAATVSGRFVQQQVREMKRQTDLQQAIAEGSSSPYVWADVRLQSRNGWNLEFVIGNSGPTVATNVRVAIDPPLPTDHEGVYIDAMHQRLSEGLSSLAPGCTLHWTLGPSADLVNRSGSLAHRVRIACDGPHGAIPANEYIIDMADFRESVARHDGTLVDVARAIAKLTEKLPDQRKPFLVELDSEGE